MRPFAIVPAPPSIPEFRDPIWMGYAGRNSETELAVPSYPGLNTTVEVASSVTVDCISSEWMYRRTQQGTIFARGASASSFFRVWCVFW
jgi:hypothetical protein